MVCTLDTIRARGRCRGSSHVVAPRRVTLVQRMLVGGNLPPRIPSLNHSLAHFHSLSSILAAIVFGLLVVLCNGEGYFIQGRRCIRKGQLT